MAKMLAATATNGVQLKELKDKIISVALSPNQDNIPTPEFENSTVRRVLIEEFVDGTWQGRGSSLSFAKYLNTALGNAPLGAELVGRYARVEDDPVDGEERFHYDLIVDEGVEAAMSA